MSKRSHACPSTVLLVERALPSVFPVQCDSLELMREICALHERARRRLQDVALPPELVALATVPDAKLEPALRRAVEAEADLLEHMAPDQIVWHTLITAARLLG